VQLISDRLNLFGTSVVGTTRNEIAKDIALGMGENETIEQIAQRLERRFNIAESTRAQTIAQTETVTAYNGGNMEGMLQSGLVEKHEWLTRKDQDVRDTHKFTNDGGLMDGQIVQLGEEFPLDSGYTGWSKAFPSDYNERCTTIPVRRETV